MRSVQFVACDLKRRDLDWIYSDPAISGKEAGVLIYKDLNAKGTGGKNPIRLAFAAFKLEVLRILKALAIDALPPLLEPS